MKKGISAVVATLLLLIITIGLTSIVAGYLFGYIGIRTAKSIDVIDAGCTSSSYFFSVKNFDTAASINSATEITLRVDGTVTSFTCTPATIPPTSTANCNTATGGTPGTFHTLRIIGPSNAVEKRVACG
ncbi:MAG: hypothetical protein QXQ18_00820 [Candidatus Aenigmatarchaeota archaeon]